MKLNRLLLTAAAALLLAACDPGYNEEYTIDNQSSHDLVFVWSGSWRYYPSENGHQGHPSVRRRSGADRP